MAKALNEMSNEERWKLFPIILEDHNPLWIDFYAKESKALQSMFGDAIFRLNHVGSSVVPRLVAKPTVDILMEIVPTFETKELVNRLEAMGYTHHEANDNPAPHIFFMKGYTTEGFVGQVVHLHVRYPDDWDELYFRDYLLDHADVAEAYGVMKLRQKDLFKHDRDAYTEAKTEFIQKYTTQAKLDYTGRYAVDLTK